MVQKNENWLKRFNKLRKVGDYYDGWDAEEVKAFIQKEIDRAVREVKKEFYKDCC